MTNTASFIKVLQLMTSVFMAFLVAISVVLSENSVVSDTPSTTQEILERYTQVVNQLKADAPAYKLVEYQQLVSSSCGDSRYKNMLDGAAKGYLTDKTTAVRNPVCTSTGSDMRAIPVFNNSKGCLPIEASRIKSATCKNMGLGVWKIVLVLESEVDPEPPAADAEISPSLHGAVFNPIGRAEIDRRIADISIFDVMFYAMTYTGCTSTVVFNSTDNHVTRWEQTVTANWISNAETDERIFDYSATITDYLKIYDLDYQAN